MEIEGVALERLKLYAAYAILGLWILSSIATFVDRSWDPPAELGIAAIAVVTMLFGSRFIPKGGGHEKHE